MSCRSRATMALAAVLSVSTASSARGDDARAIDAAKKSFEAGQEQYKRSDLEGARISFAQSYAAWPAIETLRLLAIAELNTNHFVDALKHFKTYAKDKNADPAFLNGPLPDFVARCDTRVGHIHVTTSPGAVVLVDGRRVFDPNETLDVAPGDHTVALRGEIPRAVTVRERDFVEVSLTPTAAPAVLAPQAPPPPSGPLAAPQGAEAEPATREGFWSARNTWVVGLGGAALVSAAIGTGFAIDANAKRSSFEDSAAGVGEAGCAGATTAGSCASAMQAAGSQRTDAYASQVALGIAGGLAVGAVVVWVAWPHSDAKKLGTLWLSPSIAPGSAGVTAGASF